MFRNGNAGTGDDEGSARRDIIRAGSVTAGTHHVDRVGGSFDREHFFAHRTHRAGDLVDGFAAHAQRHQQAAHLRRRGFAGHHAVEGPGGFVECERRAARDLGDQRLEIVHGSPIR